MRRPVLATAAALLLLVAGCAEQTAGNPSAGSEPSITTSEDTPPSSDTDEPTDEPSESGLADVSPCDLADESARTGLGLTGGEEKELGGARVCRFRKDGATLDESYTVSVEIFDDKGVGDIVATDVQQLPKIGGHDAAKYTGTTGGCAVSLAVSEETRVDATAVGGELQQGCVLAQQLATIVEPNLP